MFAWKKKAVKRGLAPTLSTRDGARVQLLGRERFRFDTDGYLAMPGPTAPLVPAQDAPATTSVAISDSGAIAQIGDPEDARRLYDHLAVGDVVREVDGELLTFQTGRGGFSVACKRWDDGMTRCLVELRKTFDASRPTEGDLVLEASRATWSLRARRNMTGQYFEPWADVVRRFGEFDRTCGHTFGMKKVNGALFTIAANHGGSSANCYHELRVELSVTP